MTEFRSPIPLPHIPDDLTISQFLIGDYEHPIGAPRKGVADVWFIDDSTGQQVTFEQLKARTDALTLGLAASCDIQENDVVLFFSPNHIDYVPAIWAFQRLGATVATGNPMYTSEELIHLLQLCKATRVVTDARFLGTVHTAFAAVGLAPTAIILFDITAPAGIKTISDLVSEGQQSTMDVPDQKLMQGEAKTRAALIFFSSGTSGKPKAVVLSHYAVVANIVQMSAVHRDNDGPRGPPQWEFMPGDVVTGLLPFFHVYGLILNVYWSCFMGMIVDVFPKFSLSTFLTSITKYRIAHLMVVPPHIVLICKDPSVETRDYSHVKSINTGGASLPVPLIAKAIEVFTNACVGQGYGMSELIIAAMPDVSQPLQDGSCGQMLPGYVAKVLKSDGSYGGPGERGELVMTGPSLGMGYIGDDEGTRSTFVDGWVHSGDEVQFSEDGKLLIVDRLKELIKVRGFQVAPAELEDHLLGHPYVADVCVISILDDYSGELPLALIVLSSTAKTAMESGTDESTLKAAIQKHVSDHKVKEKWLTGGVRFIEVVPKSPSGKILRRILRDEVRSETTALGA